MADALISIHSLNPLPKVLMVLDVLVSYAEPENALSLCQVPDLVALENVTRHVVLGKHALSAVDIVL